MRKVRNLIRGVLLFLLKKIGMEIDFDIQILRSGNWTHFSVETLDLVPHIGHKIILQGITYQIVDVIIRTGSQNNILRIQ